MLVLLISARCWGADSDADRLSSDIPLNFSSQAIHLTPDAIPGEIVSARRGPYGKKTPIFVQAYRTGGGQKAVKIADTPAFSDDYPDPAWTRLSPDGGSALIIMDSGDGAYHLYVYDFVRRTARRLPGVIYRPVTAWSPNSRWAVYFTEKQPEEWPGQSDPEPKKMYLYDASLEKTTLAADVAADAMISPCVAVTPHGSVLYAAKPHRQGESMDDYTLRRRPSVFEVWPGTKRRERRIKDAFSPSCSPDGQWITFLGWGQRKADPNSAADHGEVYGLYLYNTHTRSRSLIFRVDFHLFPAYDSRISLQILWSRNSRKFYAIDSNSRSEAPDSRNMIVTGRVVQVSVPEISQKTITSLSAISRVDWEDWHEKFSLHRLSEDGTTLYLNEASVVEDARKNAATPVSYMSHRKFEGVNLKTSKISLIFQGNGVDQVDWCERFQQH